MFTAVYPTIGAMKSIALVMRGSSIVATKYTVTIPDCAVGDGERTAHDFEYTDSKQYFNV